ncbi:MAG: ABC transporter ATP-binding protein [Syntrophaceticus schinkii]|nr:ABC transporter ATP-binding protein [Syntrophaceticus schinkii]
MINLTINISCLSKTYKNGTQALQDINLCIEQGIFGLLGPNGAGKTTLMRILATVMGFGEGKIEIDGLDIRRDIYEIRKIIGYLSHEFGLYPNLTLMEFLDYICLLNEITNRNERKKRVTQAVEVTGLEKVANKKLKTFSGGMKRRAGIALCLLNDPRIIIVDEPTAGLDPEERIRYKNFLSVLGREKTIVFSTHIINDLENVCSEIGVIDRGKLLFNGYPEDLIDQVEEKVWVGTCGVDEIAMLSEHFLVVNKKLVDGGWEYRIVGEQPPFATSRTEEINMEDAYLALMRGGA